MDQWHDANVDLSLVKGYKMCSNLIVNLKIVIIGVGNKAEFDK